VLKNKKIHLAIRLIVSVGLLILVLRMVNLSGLPPILVPAKPSLLVLALFATCLVRIIMTYRWAFLLRTQNCHISNYQLLKIMLMSNAIGMFFPSSLGTDGVKAFSLWKATGNATESISSIAVDRFAGFFALAVITFSGSVALAGTLATWKYTYITGTLLLLCIAITLGFLAHDAINVRLLGPIKATFTVPVLISSVNLLQAVLNFGRERTTLLKVFGLSFFAQMLRILMVFCLALAISIEVPFKYFCMLLPLCEMLLMLPISVAGVGVQEASYIYFFGPFGMSVEQAVSLSILIYMVLVWWVVIGSLIYAKEGMEKKGAILTQNKAD
jgi:uncharacterized protein (TIRG00374 family)